MKSPFAHFTLREWGDHMRAPARAAALLGTTLVLTVAAPFETATTLSALPRFFYWGLLVWLGYSAGYFGDLFSRAWLGADAALLARTFVAGTVTGIGVFIVALLLHRGFLQNWPDVRLIGFIALNVFAISYIISGVLQYVDQTPSAQTSEPTKSPALLERLPFEKRGALVFLSVEDHYVRVGTSQGEEMILIRLSDAITETAPTRGLQVHRSHWIAVDHVTAVKRLKDRASLTMSTGQVIPVSRTYLSHLKDAGLT